VIVFRAKDAAEESISGLEAEVSMVHQRKEAAEEQCERLVHELTLLYIKGYELCIIITSAPPLRLLHEGMCFAVAQHTEVVHGYPRSGQRCLWSPSQFSGTYLLMFHWQALLERLLCYTTKCDTVEHGLMERASKGNPRG
jgi:hypothetical protein